MNRILFCIAWLGALAAGITATIYALAGEWPTAGAYGAFAVILRWTQEEAEDAHYANLNRSEDDSQ